MKTAFLYFWVIILGWDTREKFKELYRQDPCERLKPPPWCKDEE